MDSLPTDPSGKELIFAEIVGNLAVVTSIVNFATGICVCKKYVTNKTTGDASAVPFLSGLLFSAFWLIYGHGRRQNKIILVNLVGLILMCSYSTVFFCYTLKKATVVKQSAANALIFYLILTNVNQENFYDNLGIMSIIFGIMTVADPMHKLLAAINVKNTECLPVPPILMTILVTALWALYGILVNEFMLTVVNIIGTAVALLQLCVITIYPRGSTTILPKYIQN